MAGDSFENKFFIDVEIGEYEVAVRVKQKDNPDFGRQYIFPGGQLGIYSYHLSNGLKRLAKWLDDLPDPQSRPAS